MSDFKWDGDEDSASVVLQHQPRTAVYMTKAGGICIRQERDAYQEDDPELFLTPQGALAVAWALIEEAHNVGLPSPSLSLMVESEYWPPGQRRSEPPAAPEPVVVGPAQPESEPGPLLRAMHEAAE